jgi:hypothetical protein
MSQAESVMPAKKVRESLGRVVLGMALGFVGYGSLLAAGLLLTAAIPRPTRVKECVCLGLAVVMPLAVMIPLARKLKLRRMLGWSLILSGLAATAAVAWLTFWYTAHWA